MKELSELFNRPGLYEDDCPGFEADDIDDPLPDEENPFLLPYVVPLVWRGR